MSREVLVAMDATDGSDRALAYALEQYPAATVHVLHVTATNDPYDIFGTPEPEEYLIVGCDVDLDDDVVHDVNSFNRAQRERAERAIDRACSIADERGSDIEPVVRSGNAVEEILACAAERGADEVVVGDHRRTALRPSVHHVPEAVAKRADRPVTIVG